MELDAGDDSHEIEGTISDFDESHTASGSSPSATAAYVDSPTAISSLNKYLAEVQARTQSSKEGGSFEAFR